jgi:uncharacterized protein involved in exopolysaccharide biosynthesis
VLSETTAGGSGPGGRSAVFWWRLTDNLFRRFGWYLLPVIALTAIGVVQATNILQTYRSTATLSASSNPLVPEQQISGVSSQFYETPAGSTSRIINERLRTDSFLLDVADEAGLLPAVENGLVPIGVVRSSVWASAQGDSILSVNASWGDPQTTYALANAIINAYQRFLADTVASDSAEAEAFYSTTLDALRTERVDTENALLAYVADLPPLGADESYPINIQLQVDRLSSSLDAVEANIQRAEGNIETARLSRVQQQTEAGRSFVIIDAPRVPNAPESTIVERATLVLSFLLLGVVISIAALLLTTVLDRSISSAGDLLAIEGVSLVATVGSTRELVSHRRRRLFARRRRARAAA